MYVELEELLKTKSWSGEAEGGHMFNIFFVSHREEFQPETPMRR